MSLRILHVIPALASRYGGPSAAAIGMCRALGAAGVETLIATTDADGDGHLPVPIGRVDSCMGVRAIFFRRQASESLKVSTALHRWLSAHVSEFDLVHVHAVFSHASLAAGRACRRRGVPCIVRPLGTLDPWSLARHRLRKRLLFYLGGRALLAGAASMHYTSHAEREAAERSLPGLPRGIVVPLGVDDVFFEPEDAQRGGSAPYVLSLSRLDVKKGIDILISAFHDLADHARTRDWTLVIAGDGEAGYVSRLKGMAAAGPARDRIRFSGWVSGQARLDLIRGACLFALPSLQENFGNAVAEALACGVPALVSPAVGLAPDIQAAQAGWVVARDRAELGAALQSAMSDRGDLAARGTGARRLAEGFRWPAVARAMVAMYEGVLARPVGATAAVASPGTVAGTSPAGR